MKREEFKKLEVNDVVGIKRGEKLYQYKVTFIYKNKHSGNTEIIKLSHNSDRFYYRWNTSPFIFIRKAKKKIG